MQKKFTDNAEAPIVAFDFDGLININGEDTYPICGEVRSWTKPVLAFMHKVGIKIIIWTSRDVAYNQDERKMYDDLTPMLDFLNKNGIYYDAINKSVQYAPYHYNGRKIYAHMSDIIRTAVTVYHIVACENIFYNLRNILFIFRCNDKSRSYTVAANILLSEL